MKKVNQQVLGIAMAMADQAAQATGAEPAGVSIQLSHSIETDGLFFQIVAGDALFGKRMAVSDTTLETLTERTAEAVAHVLG